MGWLDKLSSLITQTLNGQPLPGNSFLIQVRCMSSLRKPLKGWRECWWWLEPQASLRSIWGSISARPPVNHQDTPCGICLHGSVQMASSEEKLGRGRVGFPVFPATHTLTQTLWGEHSFIEVRLGAICRAKFWTFVSKIMLPLKIAQGCFCARWFLWIFVYILIYLYI